MNNPLLIPARVPALKHIKPEHFAPAVDHALTQVMKKVEDIKAAPPGFQNTIAPLATLFDDLGRITSLLSSFVEGAYTTELSAIDESVSQKIDSAGKTVFQDSVLGAHFDAVWQVRDTLALDEDDTAMLRDLHEAFEDSGALLPPEGQKKLRALDARLIVLAKEYTNNLIDSAGQQAIVITDPEELKGLSPDDIESFAASAREEGIMQGWRVVPERLMVDELLERAESPLFRKKIFDGIENLGAVPPYDNRPVIKEMLEKRHEVATLLGYPSYAAYTRTNGLVPGLEGTMTLLNTMIAKTLPKFEEDMRSLEEFAGAKLEPWDVAYYAAKQREAVYNFDSNGFAKYLGLETVLSGMFAEAEHLHGITFTEEDGHETIHPDIRVFAVADKETGAAIGFLHLDIFVRPGEKSGGAWMEQLQGKTDETLPVVKFNMNIIKPPPGKTALVGIMQTETAYHEMGHCIHGLIGTDVKYPAQQGTAASADFIEIHSTINEQRAFLKQNLQAHARHVDTGEAPPDDLIDRMNGSKFHFKPAQYLRAMQNSLRDLAFHATAPADYKGDKELEAAVDIKSPYARHLRSYGFARFDHLFAEARGGYAAHYVDYVIAQVYASDGFAPFVKDPYNPEQAKKLSAFYRRGSGGNPATTYHAYRGGDAAPDALLQEMGISASGGTQRGGRNALAISR